MNPRRKKKKLKVKKLILFIINIIIVVIIILFLIKFLLKNDSKGNNPNNDKTVERLKESDNYNSKYKNVYKEIEYTNIDNFEEYVNSLLDKGYSTEIINKILKKYDSTKIEYIIDNEKMELENYIDLRNFELENYSRYVEYKNKNNIDYQDAVTRVNLNLDYEQYTHTKEIENPSDIDILLNKYNYLPKDYVPDNIVDIKSTTMGAKMIKVAADAFEELVAAAKSEGGFSLLATTAYRSYSFQNTLYTNYVNKDGVVNADTYSARPGFSEHQTGYAVDVRDPNVSGTRLSDSDYDWIKKNCYKFGFILRYPKGSTPITGYIEESWHLRYLGVEFATKVTESGLTYDEYYDLYIAH
ncbi:MAG: M15 family metallopeptidase [Bacilli bacterium]|nr:M15 family metallopeptidase [Bacilli bacterium]